MTFLKCLLYALAGGPEGLAGPFDEAKYGELSAQLWEYFDRLKPFLWKQGKTYPEGVAQLHQLFANGEVDFTMSNNDGEVDNKVTLGTFPAHGACLRARHGHDPQFALHRHPAQRAAPRRGAGGMQFPLARRAMPEAQAGHLGRWHRAGSRKTAARVAGNRFYEASRRTHGPAHEDIASKALPEPAPEYMMRLVKDFRAHVIEGH